jgi:hypothetical protein
MSDSNEFPRPETHMAMRQGIRSNDLSAEVDEEGRQLIAARPPVRSRAKAYLD